MSLFFAAAGQDHDATGPGSSERGSSSGEYARLSTSSPLSSTAAGSPQTSREHLESPSHLEVLEVDLHVGLVRGATAAGCQLHIGLRQLSSNGNVCSTRLH